jgi:hypothetical protein
MKNLFFAFFMAFFVMGLQAQTQLAKEVETSNAEKFSASSGALI